MKVPKPPAGQMVIGYRPLVGLPRDEDGKLRLAFEFGPIPRHRPAQAEEPRRLTRGARPRQGSLL